MSWIPLCEHAAACSIENFYSGVDVWLKRPNVVNKRLLGAVIVAEEEEISTETLLDGDMERGRQSMVALAQLYTKELRRMGDLTVQSAVSVKGMVRELLPKTRSRSRGLEVVLTDLTNHSVIFFPLSSLKDVPNVIPANSYRLQFSQVSPATSQDCIKDISSSRYETYTCASSLRYILHTCASSLRYMLHTCISSLRYMLHTYVSSLIKVIRVHVYNDVSSKDTIISIVNSQIHNLPEAISPVKLSAI